MLGNAHSTEAHRKLRLNRTEPLSGRAGRCPRTQSDEERPGYSFCQAYSTRVPGFSWRDLWLYRFFFGP